ncbi:disease resistance protein RPV1 isoform X2 [Cryptomeria japonica]|uniref:disease resistance protein RPV1 isoform X2 n=1 Tax=Cryptomeria japonica TaxID=3369 RepID=UPI0027DA6C17|nr:disease resistance protein RPV1 isoform X2 [Cryptomeria japonica]
MVLSGCFRCNLPNSMASTSAAGETGPFDGMAPCSPSSGTYSTLMPKPSYDVFINHRGPDVKHTIASALYSIITEPTDLRSVDQGEGAYSKDFKKHKEKGRYSLDQLEEWRMALYKASFFTGQIIKNEDDETRLLKNIGNTILKVLKPAPLVVAKYPVGLNEIMEDFEVNTFQSAQAYQMVQVVGIWGIGGSGKTTLAKEIYNRRSPLMESSSFIFGVGDAAHKGMLRNKQLKLFKDLGVEGVAVDNIEDGLTRIARHLRSVRVLVVLDDVDDVDQLDTLMPIKDSLCEGSLIIVTTRENEVLKSWGISSVYKMKELDPFHAEQLFCWHAFSKPISLDGFEELVKQFVKASNGLPLSLKEFGAQLCGTSHEFWECQLDKISRVLPRNIKEAQR